MVAVKKQAQRKKRRENYMKKRHELLLTIDGLVNLGLGILLLLIPLGMAELIGVPRSNLDFYPTILGGVIFGIGIALLIERYGYARNIRGLGLGGAIAINFCGATTLLVWLVSSSLKLETRGYVFLWIIVILVYGLGIAEIVSKSWRYK
jgi:hypothetical protein